MIFFGLTGGIASGKSTVGKRFRERGLPVVDADEMARDASLPGTAGFQEIVDTFGADLIQADGRIDRKGLAARVFGNPPNLQKLNAILHPRISQLTMRRAQELTESGAPLACYEAALIVENGMSDAFRPLVVVSVSEEIQLQRLMARDQSSRDDATKRISAQLPLSKKTSVADFVIQNDGTFDELRDRTDAVLDAICARAGIDPARYPR